VEVLGIPFRLRGGRVERMVVGSDAEQLALVKVLAETRPGERLLVPGFGVPDYAFTGNFDLAALTSAMEVYGPDVTVRDFAVEETSDERFQVRLEVE
jgi:hypothetical protein